MTSGALELVTHRPEETQAMAAAFAALCRPNDVVGLCGPLGAGKTCFVRGLAAGLAVRELSKVISPTFVLMRSYAGRLTLYHFDGYRLRDGSEMEQIGCAEVFESGGVSVVEWADHVAGCLPPAHFLLTLTVAGETDRRFRLSALGRGPSARLQEFGRALTEWRA